MTSSIRRLEPEELVSLSAPLQTYGFFASPQRLTGGAPMVDLAPYLTGNLTLAVERDGRSVAELAAIPMRQNVRGLVCDMAGISACTTHPLARRQGHMRALMLEALGRMRERGCAVSCLYPFKPSMWAKFGYVGLPKTRFAAFSPRGLAPLLDLGLPEAVEVRPVAEGYDEYRAYSHHYLQARHGFAVLPGFRAARLRDLNDRWLATVRAGDRLTGVMLYRVNGFDADLTVDVMLVDDAHARAQLLRYLALHVDQVARIVLPLAPGDLPELWAADLEVTTESKVTLPGAPAPMARVLSLPGLLGSATGPGRVTVRVVDDPFIGGDHCLDGTTGKLDVSAGAAEPEAILTAAGLSGIIYGVLEPEEVGYRGLGSVTPAAAGALRSIFPRHVPHLTVGF